MPLRFANAAVSRSTGIQIMMALMTRSDFLPTKLAQWEKRAFSPYLRTTLLRQTPPGRLWSNRANRK